MIGRTYARPLAYIYGSLYCGYSFALLLKSAVTIAYSAAAAPTALVYGGILKYNFFIDPFSFDAYRSYNTLPV